MLTEVKRGQIARLCAFQQQIEIVTDRASITKVAIAFKQKVLYILYARKLSIEISTVNLILKVKVKVKFMYILTVSINVDR